jgi:secondary thiamine-phosphate synthase enzyme
MRQYSNKIQITSNGICIKNITQSVNKIISQSEIENGIINLSILNTTASLLIQENADPDVLKDIEIFFKKLVSMDENYNHSSEGLDDMPAHIKATLTNSNLTLSIIDSSLQLGVWQGIYLFEHRVITKTRTVLVHILGS